MAENIVNLGVNTDTRRAMEAATGNQLKSNDIIRLIAGERPVIAGTFLNKDLVATAFGSTDTFEMNVDIDFIHDAYAGTLNAGYTGAVTSIAITFAVDMTGKLLDAGNLTLQDTSSPSNRESVAWTAAVVDGGDPTIVVFTVSKTLVNSYSSGDAGSAQQRLMAQATESDVNTGEWTSADKTAGLLSFRLDCRDQAFTDKLTTAGTALEYKIYMEIKRYPTGSTIPIILMQDIAYGRQTVHDLESVTIPSDQNWTAADARYQKLNIPVVQVAHGLVANDVIYNNAGTWTKAKADAIGTLGVAVVSSVVDLDNFTFRASGDYSSSHGYTVGVYLYLSAATAGLLTETAPTGLTEYSQPICYTLSSSAMLVFPWRPDQALIRNLDTFGTTTTDATYAVLDTDEFIKVDATAAPNITTLPTPSTVYAGFTVTVKKKATDVSANTITVKSPTGLVEGVTGTTGIVISVTGDSRTFVLDELGVNWDIK